MNAFQQSQKAYDRKHAKGDWKMVPLTIIIIAVLFVGIVRQL